MKRLLPGIFCFIYFSTSHIAVWAQPSPEISFSRLIIYDVRGMLQDETAIILEQRGYTVKIWLKNYLGRRTGEVPYEEYRVCFDSMRQIREFALKKKYRGRLLRTHAAKGLITLAWQDDGGKQVRSIKYYAPEHTLDDFRSSFNQIWALSRYAILSVNSFESPQTVFLEDAIYFLSGAGWMTQPELQSVIQFHIKEGNGNRIAKAVWGALNQKYPRTSEFSRRSYLEYCVKKGMILLGQTTIHFFDTQKLRLSPSEKKLMQEIVNEISGKNY